MHSQANSTLVANQSGASTIFHKSSYLALLGNDLYDQQHPTLYQNTITNTISWLIIQPATYEPVADTISHFLS